MRAPVTRNSACWDRQSVFYFLSHYVYKLVQIIRFQVPGARLYRDTHLPPSLQSQLTSSLHLFTIYSPAEGLIAPEILSLYSASYQKRILFGRVVLLKNQCLSGCIRLGFTQENSFRSTDQVVLFRSAFTH